MKKAILLSMTFLLIVLFSGGVAIVLFVDCGKEASQLRASAADSIYYYRQKPTAVNLPEEGKKFLASLTKSFEAHDLDAIMAHFSEDFLHQGMAKAAFREHIAKSYLAKQLRSMTVTLLEYDARGDVVDIAGFIDTNLGPVPQSAGLLPLSAGSQLRRENGQWKFFGNRQKSPVGAFKDFLNIAASLAPQDLTLYRALLPDIFDMPASPTVSVNIKENQRVDLPLMPYRLGQINLLANYRGEEGWYVLTLPATSWVPVRLGQTLGYPKYIVDSVRFEQAAKGWRGQVQEKGQNVLSLEFDADPSVETWLESMTRPACLTVARQLLPGYWPKPVFLLMPAKHGQNAAPEVLVVKATVSSFALPSIIETFGQVRISVNPEAPWAGFFQQDAVTKGVFTQFSGNWNLKHQILNAEMENP